MKSGLDGVYFRSPAWVRSLLLNGYAYRVNRRRYGSGFGEMLDRVCERDRMDAQDMENYQKARLSGFLETARSTEYWRDVFGEHGIKSVYGTDPVELLSRLPLLDKAEVKKNAASLRNPSMLNRDLIDRKTSGTTGSGLQFVETTVCEKETWATWWRYRLRHGIRLHQKCGYFGGRTIVPIVQQVPPFWVNNRVANQIMFSAYHLSLNNVVHYVSAIKRHGIAWIHGYPSMISLLAGFMKEAGLGPIENVRNITFGAESVSGLQKQTVSEAFPAARIAEHYGLAEGVANISECEKGSLHVDEDFAFVEFIEQEKVPGLYEIVGTNWTNEAFPLLRYRTGDLVVLGSNMCTCGRHGRTVARIDGRREDYIHLPNGAVLGRIDHIFKDMSNIIEAQVQQPDRENLEVYIVKSELYCQLDEDRLKRNMMERVGNELNIQFKYVEKLNRDRSGKLKFVVSHVGAFG